MARMSFIYGLIAGLIVGVEMFLVTTSLPLEGPWSMVVGYLTMLVALSMVFIAIKRRRDLTQGGVIRFWPAFGMGLGISFVAGVLYVAAWEATVAYTHMDFASVYAQSVIAQAKAAGATGAALQKVVDQMQQFKVQYANPLYRWPMTFIEIFPVGVLVSLISAALLRNSRFMPLKRA
jgi:ABC-type multidrug transport system fused ATPase/permease subunit